MHAPSPEYAAFAIADARLYPPPAGSCGAACPGYFPANLRVLLFCLRPLVLPVDAAASPASPPADMPAPPPGAERRVCTPAPLSSADLADGQLGRVASGHSPSWAKSSPAQVGWA